MASVGQAGEGKSKSWLLMATAKGLGKRVPLSQFSVKKRGGLGNIGIKLREGDALVSLNVVHEDQVDKEDCVVATGAGMMMRTPVKGIRASGRAARGVRVVRLGEGDSVSWMTPCIYRHFTSMVPFCGTS
jgi:DNA gyrase subunit A